MGRNKSPKDAMAHGIAMIQQHFSLVMPNTVTENVILGNVHGWIDMKAYEKKIKEISDHYGMDIPIDAKVGTLAVGVQQKVEILKALYLNASILIMDEPTAVLTPQESEHLMEFIREFASQGNSVIFITHKMKEVMEVAVRIIVMRTGRVVGNVLRKETDENALAKLMVGEEILVRQNDDGIDTEKNPKVLEVNDVSMQNRDKVKVLDEISFAVHSGEIFGVAGVSGNGQDDLCDVICGLSRPEKGTLSFKGNDITDLSIKDRIALGIGYVPLDRHRDGMIASMTLAENMMLKDSYEGRWVHRGLLKLKALDSYTRERIEKFQIKATGPSDTAGSLSGGNQQKLVLAREIDVGKHLVIFNQPIRGLDIGAVDRIHQSIMQEREDGKAVLLVSTELSEIFELCDRFAVMYRGRLMGIFRRGELTVNEIGLLMAGIDRKEA